MDENEEMIDVELDDEANVDAEDGTEIEDTDGDESVEDDAEDLDDFEYDENGDIIIPDDSVNDDADDGDGNDGDEAEGEGESEGEPGPTENSQPAEKTADKQRIADLEKELADFKKYGAAALKKLGVEGDNVTDGLIKLAAEAEGITPEAFKENIAKENSHISAAQERQAAIEREDLAAIQAAFPSTKTYKNISEIPNFKRFGELRDGGATPLEAYRAANPDGVLAEAAQAAKATSIKGTKDHLKSSVPKGSKDNSVRMSRAELSEWRDMFPGKSDKEIARLYKEASK